MQRLTTRGIRTAQAVRDREDFITSGALRADNHKRGSYLYTGPSNYLNDVEAEQFRIDNPFIDYVVWSYSTPIAWHKTVEGVGTWHKVAQKFSVTTSKHQGNLYLI